jgi:hypothetical protein
VVGVNRSDTTLMARILGFASAIAVAPIEFLLGRGSAPVAACA